MADNFDRSAVENNLVDQMAKEKKLVRRSLRRDVQLGNLSAASADMGTVTTGAFVSPSGADSDPTSAAFSGVVQTGVAITANDGTDLNWGSIESGTAQVYIDPVTQELVGGAGTVRLGRSGLTLDGADLNALLTRNEFGWMSNQTATEGSETRTARSGLISDGTKGEQIHQIFKPGSAVTIPNGDFASLDMTGWTEAQKGSVSTPLGTLSTAFTAISSIVVDSFGNFFVGIVNGATTSGVWKYDSSLATWSAHGTLDPTIKIRSLAIDTNNLLYAGGGTSGGAAVVYEYVNGAWSLVTTIDASGVIYSLATDTSNNCFAGGSGLATSAVYKRTAGSGNFSAHGTLDPTKICYALKVNTSNTLIAGGTFSTSSVWSVASGSTTWAAVSTLTGTSVTQNGIAIKSNGDIVASGSKLYVYTSGAWTLLSDFGGSNSCVAIDSLDNIYIGDLIMFSRYESGVADNDSNNLRDASSKMSAHTIKAILAYGSSLYCVGTISDTSSAWKVTVSNWSGATGKATGNTDSNQNAILINQARYAVTAGNQYNISQNSQATATSGTATITMTVKFYTALTAGSLVSTATLATRTGVSLSDLGSSKVITAPATATHAIFHTTISTTGAASYALDNFAVVGVTPYGEIKLNDTGIVINDNANNADVRIEGQTDANLLTVDASADKVGIGTATPAYKLDVNGDINVPAANIHRMGGLATQWNPLAPPVSPNANDDEFQDASAGVPSGWTEFDPNSLLTVSENSYGLLMTQTTRAGENVTGIYKALPSGNFTIITRAGFYDCTGASNIFAGIALWENAADTTKKIFCNRTYPTATDGTLYIDGREYTNHNTASTAKPSKITDIDTENQIYIRLRRNGANYTMDYSANGVLYKSNGAAFTLSFTPTYMGLFSNNVNSGATIRPIFDFFRYVGSDEGQYSVPNGRRV